MNIFYKFDGKMYINITNGCPCDCVFCIRENGDGIGDSGSLWLEHEPSYEEIIDAYNAFDKSGITEAVFCGYGEPTVRIDMLLETARYIKEHSRMKIRLNTNGLVRLMYRDFKLSSFKGLIDSVSVSLNAPNSDRYDEITRPSYGSEDSFAEMISFAVQMKNLKIKTVFTVVDILSAEETEQCRKLASMHDIGFRVRHRVTDNKSYT